MTSKQIKLLRDEYSFSLCPRFQFSSKAVDAN